MSSNVNNASNGMIRSSRSARADGHERGASSLLQLATTADDDGDNGGDGAGAGARPAADTVGKQQQPQSQSQPGVNDDEHQIMQILANMSQAQPPAQHVNQGPNTFNNALPPFGMPNNPDSGSIQLPTPPTILTHPTRSSARRSLNGSGAPQVGAAATTGVDASPYDATSVGVSSAPTASSSICAPGAGTPPAAVPNPIVAAQQDPSQPSPASAVPPAVAASVGRSRTQSRAASRAASADGDGDADYESDELASGDDTRSPAPSTRKGRGGASGRGRAGAKSQQASQQGQNAAASTSAEPQAIAPADGTAMQTGEGAGLAGDAQVPETDWTRTRKDNHKEVERRRRETINEGINELKKIVPNCDRNNKGAILRLAVDYIRKLKDSEAANVEKWSTEMALSNEAIASAREETEGWKTSYENAEVENEELRRENRALRAEIERLGGKVQVGLGRERQEAEHLMNGGAGGVGGGVGPAAFSLLHKRSGVQDDDGDANGLDGGLNKRMRVE